MSRWMLVMLVCLATALPAHAAKEITLKDGRTLQGEVAERDGVLTINAAEGLFQFPREQVTEIKDISPAPHLEAQKGAVQVAQGGSPSAGASPAAAAAASAATPAATAVDVPGNNPVVTLHTSHGDIQLELYEDDAPNTVANFIKLSESGFYEGTFFHRIIKGFMMQGGDPNTKTADTKSYGMGGPGYGFDDECPHDASAVKRKNERGAISMAHSDAPSSNGSQFFILFKDAPHLDGKHTVFGHVVKGMDIVDKVETSVAPASGEEPLERVVIQKVTVDRKRDHKYEPVTHPDAR